MGVAIQSRVSGTSDNTSSISNFNTVGLHQAFLSECLQAYLANAEMNGLFVHLSNVHMPCIMYRSREKFVSMTLSAICKYTR